MKLNALSFFTDIRDNELVIKLVFGSLLIGLLIFLIIYAAKKEKILTREEKTKRLVSIAIFSALSIVLYLLKFNLPMIFPSFLEIQFSNVPVLIGGFMFGPISGVVIVVVRAIVKLPMTSTVGVGEFADLIIGVAVVLVTSLIYQKHKTKKNAAISLLFGSITWVIIALLANWLFLTSFYILLFFDGNLKAFVGFLSVIPGINEGNYMSRYLLLGILPFNIVLSTLVSLVTFLVYKRISVFVHSLPFDKQEKIESKNN